MEKINGRTPEEIKTALGMCSEICFGRSDCPYYDGVNERCQTKLTFDALALIERLESERDAALAKVPKWISVKERLPKEYAFCLVAIKDYGYGTTHTDIAAYDGEIWVKDAGSYYDIIDKGEVICWAKLPEPPEVSE